MDTASQHQQRDKFREILAWLRGGDITPDPEMEDKFIDTITGMVIDRMKPAEGKDAVQVARQDRPVPGKGLYKDRPHPLSLKAIMREATGDDSWEPPKFLTAERGTPVQTCPTPQQRSEAEPSPSGSPSEGIDSVILARTLVYFSKCNVHPINISQIQIILYIAYGVFLAQKGKKLSDEHPRMWEYGPVFPKAYNRLRKSPSDGKEEAESLRRTAPEIYNFLEANFHRFAWTSATVLSSPHTAPGTPWEKARKKSPDKWGAVIEDSDICSWFAKRLADR